MSKILFIPFISHTPEIDKQVFGDSYIETIKTKNASVVVAREGKESKRYSTEDKLSDIFGVKKKDLNRYKD